MLFIDNLILQISNNLLEFMNVSSSFSFNLLSFFIALIIFSSHIVNVFRSRLSISLAYLFDSFIVDGFKHVFSCLIGLLFENQIIKTACKAVHLHVVQEQLVEASHQLTSCGLTIQLGKGVQKSIIRVRSNLVLIDKSFQELIVNKNNLSLLFISFHI